MRAKLISTLAGACLLALADFAQAMPKPELPRPVVVPPVPPGTSPRGVELSRVVVNIPDGRIWQYNGGNLACSAGGESFKWSSETSELKVERFAGPFTDEMRKTGFSRTASDDLFEGQSSSDMLVVGARITDIQSYICAFLFGSYHDTMLIEVEWQIFDPLRRETLAKIKTVGGVDRAISSLNDVQLVLIDAFRENARILLADPAFREAVLKPEAKPETGAPAGSAPIRLTFAAGRPERPISDVPASVVALFTGNSMGSGFLVSDDGYILTNQHVVGAATKVRVRWSDGLETNGEVIRSDNRRDVALVKTEPRGRPALAVVRGSPAVGAPVYAVGTPLDESMLNTVTRGIVSANRFIDGFAFIQSDVGVTQGNSGGPLLDDKGRVIGITVIKLFADEGQRNLNLFIPIGDALDFLALKTGG